MRRTMRLCAVLTVALVAGCSTIDANEGHPSVGRDSDDYRESPCACNEVPQRYKQQFTG